MSAFKHKSNNRILNDFNYRHWLRQERARLEEKGLWIYTQENMRENEPRKEKIKFEKAKGALKRHMDSKFIRQVEEFKTAKDMLSY